MWEDIQEMYTYPFHLSWWIPHNLNIKLFKESKDSGALTYNLYPGLLGTIDYHYDLNFTLL